MILFTAKQFLESFNQLLQEGFLLLDNDLEQVQASAWQLFVLQVFHCSPPATHCADQCSAPAPQGHTEGEEALNLEESYTPHPHLLLFHFLLQVVLLFVFLSWHDNKLEVR